MLRPSFVAADAVPSHYVWIGFSEAEPSIGVQEGGFAESVPVLGFRRAPLPAVWSSGSQRAGRTRTAS
jgi:hypothetical protein